MMRNGPTEPSADLRQMASVFRALREAGRRDVMNQVRGRQ